MGEAESHINNIHPGGIYNDGFTIDVTSNNKEALLPVDGKGGGNFLDEFMNGKGPMVSVMMDDHPYTQSMQDAPGVESARNYMRNDYYLINKSFPARHPYRKLGPYTASQRDSIVKVYKIDLLKMERQIFEDLK